MKNGLKLILLVVSVVLCFSLLTACGGNQDNWTPTGKDVTLIAKGDSAKYLCIYEGPNLDAKNAALSFKSELGKNGLKCVQTIFGHTSESGDYEILFGETDREASKVAVELLKSKEAENKDAYHWVFYYRDGKLAIAANGEIAYKFAIEDFFEKHLTDGGIVFKDTLKEHVLLTYDEYEEYLVEQETIAAEEKKKEHEQYIPELLALLNTQRTELNGIQRAWDRNAAITSQNPQIYIFQEYTEDMVYEAANDYIADVYEHQSPAKYPTKKQHPRLLITEDNLPLIKKVLVDDNPTNETFKSLVENVLANNGVLPSSSNQGTNATLQTSQVHNYSSSYLYTIQAKALAYQLYGDAYYGYQAILYLKNYIESLDIITLGDQCRYYGYVMFTAAIVYDWCYDLLTETDKTQIIAGVENCLCRDDKSLKSSESKMEVLFPPQDQVAIAGHGNEYQILRDFLAFSVAIYDEVPSWYEYVGGRVYNDFLPAREYLYQAGVTWQGTGYAFTRHAPTLFSAWILQVATGENPYSDVLHDAIEGLFNYEVAPGYTFSDGDKTGDLWPIYDHSHHAYLAAYLYKDSAMLNLADFLYNTEYQKNAGKDPYSNSGYGGLQSVSFIVLRSLCDLEPNDNRYENMELIKYYGSFLGQYVVREAWDDDSSAAVFMKIKERSTSGHEHLDAGTFEIYYKGMLTTDGGCYNNDGHEHSMYFHDATISHNGLIIYNSALSKTEKGWYSGGQRRVPDTNSMTLEAWNKNSQIDTGKVIGKQHAYADEEETQPLYAYIAGDITKAYDASTVSYVGRRMLTVYTGDEEFPMVFFVFDDIFANSKSFEKRFLLQITSENAPTISGNTVITENGDGRLVLTCLSSGIEINPVGGRAYKSNGDYDSAKSSNYIINGQQLRPLDNGKDDDGHWGRVEIVSTRSTKETTFMNVLYVTDKGNDESVEIKKIGNASGVEGGVFNGKIAAVFAIDRNGAKDKLSFTVSGNGNIDYYVSGVTAGEWKVAVDGKDCGTYTATEEGGLLTFTAPAGSVSISPVK
ncbi:MAG: heparinase II/III family protein [Clostridia bacterium]|nr:heparinase II/III family protein [Clostridia bacterium]